jgi:hypothetical protein
MKVGIAVTAITINTRDGKEAEIVVYETSPGIIYVSSSVVK